MPSTVIRKLLSHFRWDKEKFMRWFKDDTGDQENKLIIEANHISGLECGHNFCNPCWTKYLTLKILYEGMSQTISCAAHNCNALIDDTTVMKLVTDSKVRAKYQLLIINNFVEVIFILFFLKITLLMEYF